MPKKNSKKQRLAPFDFDRHEYIRIVYKQKEILKPGQNVNKLKTIYLHFLQSDLENNHDNTLSALSNRGHTSGKFDVYWFQEDKDEEEYRFTHICRGTIKKNDQLFKYIERNKNEFTRGEPSFQEIISLIVPNPSPPRANKKIYQFIKQSINKKTAEFLIQQVILEEKVIKLYSCLDSEVTKNLLDLLKDDAFRKNTSLHYKSKINDSEHELFIKDQEVYGSFLKHLSDYFEVLNAINRVNTAKVAEKVNQTIRNFPPILTLYKAPKIFEYLKDLKKSLQSIKLLIFPSKRLSVDNSFKEIRSFIQSMSNRYEHVIILLHIILNQNQVQVQDAIIPSLIEICIADYKQANITASLAKPLETLFQNADFAAIEKLSTFLHNFKIIGKKFKESLDAHIPLIKMGKAGYSKLATKLMRSLISNHAQERAYGDKFNEFLLSLSDILSPLKSKDMLNLNEQKRVALHSCGIEKVDALNEVLSVLKIANTKYVIKQGYENINENAINSFDFFSDFLKKFRTAQENFIILRHIFAIDREQWHHLIEESLNEYMGDDFKESKNQFTPLFLSISEEELRPLQAFCLDVQEIKTIIKTEINKMQDDAVNHACQVLIENKINTLIITGEDFSELKKLSSFSQELARNFSIDEKNDLPKNDGPESITANSSGEDIEIVNTENIDDSSEPNGSNLPNEEKSLVTGSNNVLNSSSNGSNHKNILAELPEREDAVVNNHASSPNISSTPAKKCLSSIPQSVNRNNSATLISNKNLFGKFSFSNGNSRYPYILSTNGRYISEDQALSLNVSNNSSQFFSFPMASTLEKNGLVQNVCLIFVLNGLLIKAISNEMFFSRSGEIAMKKVNVFLQETNPLILLMPADVKKVKENEKAIDTISARKLVGAINFILNKQQEIDEKKAEILPYFEKLALFKLAFEFGENLLGNMTAIEESIFYLAKKLIPNIVVGKDFNYLIKAAESAFLQLNPLVPS